MVYRPKVNKQLCFVLMPFDNSFTENYNRIIRPAAAAVGLQTLRSDEIYGIRPIILDIWHSIWQARIAIADVTARNPNVNYELGLCHALGVPTVLISNNIKDVPFDYQHRRCIIYNRNVSGWEQKLFDDLKKTLEAVLFRRESIENLPWPYTTFLRETISIILVAIQIILAYALAVYLSFKL